MELAHARRVANSGFVSLDCWINLLLWMVVTWQYSQGLSEVDKEHLRQIIAEVMDNKQDVLEVVQDIMEKCLNGLDELKDEAIDVFLSTDSEAGSTSSMAGGDDVVEDFSIDREVVEELTIDSDGTLTDLSCEEGTGGDMETGDGVVGAGD